MTMRFRPNASSVRTAHPHTCRSAMVLLVVLMQGLLGCGSPVVPTQSLAGMTVSAGQHSAQTFLPTSDGSIITVRARTDAADEDSLRDLGRLFAALPLGKDQSLVVHFYPNDAPTPPSTAMPDGTLGADYERWIIGSYTRQSNGTESVTVRVQPASLQSETIGGHQVQILIQPDRGTLTQPTEIIMLNYIIAMDDPRDSSAREAIANHFADLHPESLSLTITLLPRSARWKDYPAILPYMDDHVAGQLVRFKDGPVEWKPKN